MMSTSEQLLSGEQIFKLSNEQAEIVTAFDSTLLNCAVEGEEEVEDVVIVPPDRHILLLYPPNTSLKMRWRKM
jgi:hypothetical protein